MTLPWLICSSLAAAWAVAPGATLTGRIELRDSKEKTVSAGRDFSGVVVWLEPVGGTFAKPEKPGRATMLQKGKRFLPHVLAIRTGTVVDFPNLDPVFHNAFSNYSGQLFDVGLYKPGTSRAVPFTRPGIVRVFCNIHPNMSAVIAVIDTPWFAVSNAAGTFRIEGVPPGEYRLQVFHERATQQALGALQRKVTVSSDAVLPPIVVSETGYIPSPHLNKHGEPYSSDSGSYKVLR